MRRVILAIGLLCTGATSTLFAQQGNGKADNLQTARHQRNPAKAKAANTAASQPAEIVTLQSTDANKAYSNRRFSIADPTIRLLNRRAQGLPVPVHASGIVGMPKSTYGLANGKLMLRPTTATSSGTVSGSGAVGTGTTILGAGTGENATGVNGKNPYAGPSLWGDRLPVKPVAAKSPAARSH